MLDVFPKDDKYYSQMFLDECLYELSECYNIKELMFQKELTLVNQINQNNAQFLIIGISKILAIDLNHIFEMVDMI